MIVLRSYGTGPFCAGASFDKLVAIRDAAAGQEFFMGFARVILAMTQSTKPIVTRVQGKVVGGGVGIVAASDYAMAVDAASLRLSELAIGIGPFVVGPVIERKIPVPARSRPWRSTPIGATRPGASDTDCTRASFRPSMRSTPPSMRSRDGSPRRTRTRSRIKRMTWSGIDNWPHCSRSAPR